MKILIVGVGALGSHLSLFLRNYQLSIIDFDKVETKNVLSQFHAKSYVGKSKVESLSKTLSFLFGTKLSVTPHKLTKDNVKTVLSGHDIIIDCLDNAEARILIQTFVRTNNVPCLHGALAPNGEMGRAIWDEEFTIDSEQNVGAATCENGDHLPFISLVSATLARSVDEYIKSGKKLSYNVFPISGVKLV